MSTQRGQKTGEKNGYRGRNLMFTKSSTGFKRGERVSKKGTRGTP